MEMETTEKKKVSVICPYNDRAVLDSMLIPSLKKQASEDWELIAVDTKAEHFTSAAAALNYGAGVAQGEILLFVHQDISFEREDFISELIKICETETFGVGGVAGIVGKEKQVYSAVTHDLDRHHAGKICASPMEVDSVDECCFFVLRDKFKGFEDYGETWHLYAVEYSLQCRRNGEAVKIFPLEVYHLSPGWSLNKSYYATLKKVEKNYRKAFRRIDTTMGCFPTGAVKLRLFLFARSVYHKLTGQKR